MWVVGSFRAWLGSRGGFRAPPSLLSDCPAACARPLTAGLSCPRCLTSGTPPRWNSQLLSSLARPMAARTWRAACRVVRRASLPRHPSNRVGRLVWFSACWLWQSFPPSLAPAPSTPSTPSTPWLPVLFPLGLGPESTLFGSPSVALRSPFFAHA